MDGSHRMTRRMVLRSAGMTAAATTSMAALPVAAAMSQTPDTALSPARRATYQALVTAVARDPGLALPSGGVEGLVRGFAATYAESSAAERSDLDTILDAAGGDQAGGTPLAGRSTAQQVDELKRNLRGEGRGATSGGSRVPAFTAAALTIAAAPFCPPGTQVPPLGLLIQGAYPCLRASSRCSRCLATKAGIPTPTGHTETALTPSR